MRGWASFDDAKRYRYSLHRRWATPGEPVRRVGFCLLNPSTADARVLDPTLSRCHRFAVRWGFSAMEVVNIFALRSTDPTALARSEDPVGPGNDRAIRRACARCELIVAGWGNHGRLHDRSDAVRTILHTHAAEPVRCWALTKAGEPGHPLYLRADTELRDLP